MPQNRMAYMKILLVQSYTRHTTPVFPLGLSYVAATLTGDHTVAGFDPNRSVEPWKELAEKVEAFAPDAVGISLRNVDSCMYAAIERYYEDFVRILRTVKSVSPGTKIVVGGSGFSIYAKDILSERKEIDVGVYLEGEETARELFKDLDSAHKVQGCFVKEGQGFRFTGPRAFLPMSQIARPDYDVFDPSRYVFPNVGIGLQSKRGCDYGCSYCPYPFLNGRGMRLRAASDVVDEMEFLHQRYRIPEFAFVDSVFNAPQSHAVEICQDIIRRGLRVRWSAYSGIQDFDESYARLALQAGCTNFLFSADALSDRSLKALGKPYAVKDIRAVGEITAKLKERKTGFDFFLDPPESRLPDFFRVVAFLFGLKWRLREHMNLRVLWIFNRIRIEPHTRIFDLAVEKGLIQKDRNMLEPVFYSESSMRLISAPFALFFALLRPVLRLKLRNRTRRYLRNTI